MYKCKNNVIITIGRTFGSGGREIGKKVADELGIPFYDKELLELAAKDGRINVYNLSRFDEKKASSFFYSMTLNPYTGEAAEPLDMMAQNILEHVINTVASRGPCVIVGRRADKILREKYDVLSVFISASNEKRIARVSKRDGLPEKESKKKILKADKSRRAFYNSEGEGEWGEAANYNLCVDSGDLGTGHSAAMILHYLKLKDKLVSIIE